jgi:CRP-like cAMP-binding protein
MSLLGENSGRTTASVVASGEVVVRIVPVDYIFNLLSKDHELSFKFFRYIATKMALTLISFDDKTNFEQEFKKLNISGSLRTSSSIGKTNCKFLFGFKI